MNAYEVKIVYEPSRNNVNGVIGGNLVANDRLFFFFFSDVFNVDRGRDARDICLRVYLMGTCDL